MRSERRYLSSILSGLFVLLCAGAIAGALNNAFGDEPQLEGQAREVACSSLVVAPADGPGKPGSGAVKGDCKLRTTRLETNPIRRSFDFDDGAARVHVQCSRAYLLVGDYTCKMLP